MTNGLTSEVQYMTVHLFQMMMIMELCDISKRTRRMEMVSKDDVRSKGMPKQKITINRTRNRKVLSIFRNLATRILIRRYSLEIKYCYVPHTVHIV